jgi:hypothetical protein
LHGAGLPRGGGCAIDGDQAGIDEADLAVLSLNSGEEKAIDKDREALSAGQGCDNFIGLPRLAEDLSVFRMVGAVDVAHVVSPSG